MAKRPVGLGKAAKNKKQKVETAQEPSNELTVELSEEIDANDDMGQLKALWNTYTKSERDNELVVNGVIHECDRILRNNEGKEELPLDFHTIYSLALCELANFHLEQVEDYFKASLERIEIGLTKYPQSIDCLFVKTRVLLHQFSLQHLAKVDIDSTGKDLSGFIDEITTVYELAESLARKNEQYELFNRDNLSILLDLDDVLDIIHHFGEDEEEDDEEPVELSEDHPLFKIRSNDTYTQWWQSHIINFLEFVDLQLTKLAIDFEAEYEKSDDDTNDLIPLRRDICSRIGQSYLQQSETPSTTFTTLTYDEEYEDVNDIDGLTRPESQKLAQDLISSGLKYLKWAKKYDDPETWVNEAEAMISLGNLYDVDSEEQEKQYKLAETLLEKANNVTNGKYDDILENLRGGEWMEWTKN